MISEFSQSLDTFMKRVLSGQTLQVFLEQVAAAANFGNQPGKQCSICISRRAFLLKNIRRVFLPLMPSVSTNKNLCCPCNMVFQKWRMNHRLCGSLRKWMGNISVIWIPEDEQIHCSKEPEHSGLLCRRSLQVLVKKNNLQLPIKMSCLAGDERVH
ncbi:putative protein FAR1-RELATED SEQUENCE 10 [Tripterygium wilfordii]|uniref:putative protein FAR1-RELATED SEQUENCE 10 n=1 Tax=Tripterygium wilfordii TaxID=458696 RepID=UPI0018F86000|nr:putative protein FAR1-RELATED SEQUENCE 10 [Tripterygium wilfordii]XP_038704318.1 putative protein FAR1-RELATED SEQUENCE 10 [Tripterygium wilfordii]